MQVKARAKTMITRIEFDRLCYHIYKSNEYGSEGTFHKYNEKNGEYTYDKKEFERVSKTIDKIANKLFTK